MNIFKSIGDFFTNVVFAPLHFIRNNIDDWWQSNIINIFFIFIGFALFFYWMGQAFKFKKQGTEDLPFKK